MKKVNNIKYVELDLKKIFLTFPSSLYEKIISLVFLTLSFMVFFGPLIMRGDIEPYRAVISAIIPAFTTSWGLLVLIRYLFYKTNYSK